MAIETLEGVEKIGGFEVGHTGKDLSELNKRLKKRLKKVEEEIRYPVDETRLQRWHYHGVAKDTQRFKDINDKTRELAQFIMERVPPSRNLSLALTALEDVRMRSNAAIAVDEQYL